MNEALRDPIKSQLYMERYVNRGSPSGFSSVNTTSLETSHLGEERTFWLHAVRPSSSSKIVEFGESSFIEPGLILIHPDLVDSCPLLDNGKLIRNFIEVAPTSSDRTVQAVAEPNLYFKLSYPPLIGRISRQLGLAQAEAAVWVTHSIDRAVRNVDPRFRFLREGYARVAVTKSPRSVEWGFAIRDRYPSPEHPRVDLMIPGFSLFSRDRYSPTDDFLLYQLFRRQQKPLIDFVFEDLIKPLIDSYFSLIVNCGLQLEAHAQNILFGIDGEGRITSVVARDAESIDRDISLMDELKIVCERPAGSYKIIQRSDYNYQIMHSFMYDFKMGEYLIRPIMECASECEDLNPADLSARVQQCARNWLAHLPNDFFPADGCWYSYENVVHDRKRRREYVATPDPQFR
ncbi:MAG: hypothetical protein U1E37_08765 [Sphingomonadaceae bacterium]